MAAGIVSEITGTVTKVNGTGFKIAEREDWINVSRYAVDGEAPMPALGQHVKIGLDKSGFARKITALEQSQAAPSAEHKRPSSRPRLRKQSRRFARSTRTRSSSASRASRRRSTS